MRCTCNRSVVAFTSASSTRRTKFRSLDHKCSRHLWYSPEIEYFDSARSNAMAPSSTTTAACAPLRKSESIWLSESGVMELMGKRGNLDWSLLFALLTVRVLMRVYYHPLPPWYLESRG